MKGKAFGLIQFTVLALFSLALDAAPAPEETSLPATPVPVENEGAENSVETRDKFRFEALFKSRGMATYNSGPLKDYNSLALGGQLGLVYTPWSHLVLGSTFFNTTRTAGTDLTKGDNSLGSSPKLSRYALGLYDVTHPEDHEVTLLGEAYVEGKLGNQRLRFGRSFYKTPFLNPQNGRMIPTLFQGAFYELPLSFGSGLDWTNRAAWITHVYARSTSSFRTVEDSLQYTAGRNRDGTAVDYFGKVNSDGIGYFSTKLDGKHFYGEFHETWFENVFLLSYAEAGANFNTDKMGEFHIEAQAAHEKAMGDGGSSYYEFDEEAFLYGGRAGYSLYSTTLWFSGNRITDQGRFIFPREWGREPFFTFMRRERSEGLSDATNFKVSLEKPWGKFLSDFRSELAWGYFKRAPVSRADQNKYAIPSYRQVNFEIGWRSAAKGARTEIGFLWAHKYSLGNPEDKVIYNKTDMHHFDLTVLHYFI